MAAKEILRRKRYKYQGNQSTDTDECWSVRFDETKDMPMGEMLNEIDVAKYYKALCSSVKKGKASAYKSTSSQTEPDASGISPSWILAGQQLVSELYDGLGNAINTLYHSAPSDIFKGEEDGECSGTKDPKDLKYFTYENGYWTSKLVPDIKIPVLGDLDYHRQILHSKDFKQKLENLMGIASRLKDLIPYVDYCLELPKETSDVKVPSSVENKSQQTEEANTQYENDDFVITPTNEIENSTDGSETSDVNSDRSVDAQATQCTSTPKPPENLVGETSNDNSETTPVVETNVKKGAKGKSSQVPGVVVSRYKLEPQAQLRVQMARGATRSRMDAKVPRNPAKFPEAVKRDFITVRDKSFQQAKQLPNVKSSRSTKGRVETGKVSSVNYSKLKIKEAKEGLDRSSPTKEKKSICISSTNQPKLQEQLKVASLIKDSKNFIQKNILAARLKSNAAGPSNAESGSRPNLSQTTQKGKAGGKIVPKVPKATNKRNIE